MIDAPFSRRVAEEFAGLGIDAEALADLLARAQREIDEGRLPSCQLAFAREGKLVEWTTLGDATTTSRYIVFSATKAVVASAMWILMGEGAVDVTRRVVDYVPEFGTNGKDVITVEQVLLHTSGFPRAPFSPPDWDDRDRRLARFAQWRTNWEPGTRFEYHATTAHWVLAEIIERVTGTDFREYIRTRVIEPLGLPGLEIGCPVEHQDDINTLVATGAPASPDELEAVLGIREIPAGEVTTEFLLKFNRADWRAVGVPGGGGVATAADLALFYQALLHDPLEMWEPDVLTDVTSKVRNTMRDFLGVPANRTRGLVVHGDDDKAHVRGMGRTISARAFGHSGAGGQIAWADPETGASFCFLTNGIDEHELRQARRTSAIASRAGNCIV